MALGGGSGGSDGVRAGRAYVELGAKDGMTGVLKRVGERFAAFGKMVLAATGVGGIIGGILGGLSFKDTADDLAKMNDVAKAFGITGSRASGLFGLLATAGGEFKENVEGVIQFSEAIDKATQGAGQGKELFAGLAVSARDIAGQPIDEQFFKVLGAIRQLPQPLQESKLALLGGTDSLKQWQRLLSMSEEDMRRIAADMAISTAELEDATKASRGLEKAGAAINRVWQQAVIMLSPLVADLAGRVVEAMKPVIEWMKGRTMQDVWDELLARADEFAAGVRVGVKMMVDDVTSYFVSKWDEAVLGVKAMFADLGISLANSVGLALVALGKANPLMAGAVLPAIAEAGKAKGAAQAAKDAAGDEFAAAELKRQKEMADRQAQAAEEMSFADNRRWAELDRIERGRQVRQQDPDNPMQKKAAVLGRAWGTFGAGAFLTQGFGSQSASPAKQTVDQLKKVNEKLGDIFDKLDSADPLLIV